MIAALLLFSIQCVNGDFGQAEARVSYKSEQRLVELQKKPDLRSLKRYRFDDVTIYAAAVLADRNEAGPERTLRLYAVRAEKWWQLREQGKAPLVEDGWEVNRHEPGEPVLVERARKHLMRVSYAGRWRGANASGRNTRTLLLDFADEQPRIAVTVACEESGGGGACGAPNHAHSPHRELTCDGTLRCTSTETLRTDWATRTAARMFHLLTNETIPPRRFDAVTYRSGNAFAQAFAADRGVIRQRALIETVGVVEPLFQLSHDRVLFAAAPRVESVAVRFFLLSREPARWREIPLARLPDDGYPATPKGEQPLAPDHTPLASSLQFQTFDLELQGNRRLLEVVAREGESHAIYWIMLDPAGRNGALRVATDTPEWGHCVDVRFPTTATTLGIPDTGLPALVEAIHSWSRVELEDGRLPKRCNLTGTIGWSSKSGWQVRLAEAPCTDPIPRPFAATISDDGNIRVQQCKPWTSPYGPGPDFAPPAERCVP